MNRWRVVVVLLVLAAILAGVISSLAFEPDWPVYPGMVPHFVRRGFTFFGPEGQGGLLNLMAWIAGVLSQYLIGVITLFVAPRRMRQMSVALSGSGRRLGVYFLIGLCLAAALVPVGLLSALTVHTFPLPFILIGIFFVSALAGTVALTYELGSELLRRAAWERASPLARLALGTLILYGVTRVPFLGIIVSVVVWLAGAGAAVATRMGSGRAWTLTPLVEE